MLHTFEMPIKSIDSTLFRDTTGCDLYILQEKLVISGEITKVQAKAALDAHNPPDPAVVLAANATAKAALLSRLGITADEAKLLLG